MRRTIHALIGCLVAAAAVPALVASTPAAVQAAPVPSTTSGEKALDVQGQKIQGVVGSADGAPLLSATTGTYQDTIPDPDQVKYYQVKRTIPKSTLYVGATTRRAPGVSKDQLDIRLTTLDGETTCNSDATWENTPSTRWLMTSGLSSFATDSSAFNACQDASRLVFSVEQTSDVRSLAGTPVEIVVSEEPPLSKPDGLPTADTAAPTWETMPSTGSETRLSGEDSFKDAPTVGSGTYTSNIEPGGIQIYRVKVDWGQRLQAHLRVPAPTESEAANYDSDQAIGVQILGPSRADVQIDDNNDYRYSVDLEKKQSVSARAHTWPVKYLGRNDSANWDARATSMAGYYYVAVILESDLKDQSYRVPFTLQITHLGAKTAAPPYVRKQAPLGPGFTLPQDDDNNDLAVREKGTAIALGGGGAVLFVAGLVVLFLLRRTPKTSPATT